jgi:hypothetical protein
MKRKRKMAQVQHRAAWRPTVFKAMWLEEVEGDHGYSERTKLLGGRSTASGRVRWDGPVQVEPFPGFIGRVQNVRVYIHAR